MNSRIKYIITTLVLAILLLVLRRQPTRSPQVNKEMIWTTRGSNDPKRISGFDNAPNNPFTRLMILNILEGMFISYFKENFQLFSYFKLKIMEWTNLKNKLNKILITLEIKNWFSIRIRINKSNKKQDRTIFKKYKRFWKMKNRILKT